MELSPETIGLIIKHAIELGATTALIKAGKLKPYLKKSEAFKKFGRVTIEHWLRDGLVKPRKDGDHSAAWRLDRIELEILYKSIQILEIINQ